MGYPSDKFMVSRTATSTIRRCPFCGGLIEDAALRDINFIVHLGNPTIEHQHKHAWADYVGYINRR